MAKFLALIVILLVAFGCGGDGSVGGGSSLLNANTIRSTVNLDSARGNDLSTLTVATSAKSASPSAAGQVDVVVFNNGPQFTSVKDAQGRLVLLGMVSETAPNLNAESTARAVAYMALGGPWKKAEGRQTILNEAHTIGGFSELVSQIQSQLNAQGFLTLEDAPIQQALETYINNAAGLGGAPDGTIVEPSTASGLSVDSTIDGVLTVENVRLRRVALHLRRTGYKDASGTVQEEPNLPFVKQNMPLVARYGGITGTLAGYLSGEIPYSPVRSAPPFEIPRVPVDARETYYQMIALGPGSTDGPAFNILTQDQREDLAILEIKALFLDVILVLYTNAALPFKGKEVDEFLQFAAGNAIITDIVNNIRSTVPEAVTLVREGKYGEAAKKVAQSTVTSNSIIPAVAQLTLDFIDQNSSLSAGNYDRILGSMDTVISTMGKIDIGVTVLETGLLYADFINSNRTEKFNITVIGGKITLTSPRTTIRPTSSTTIKAIIQDRNPNATYQFQWQVSPNSNYWVEDRALNGTDDAPDGILRTAQDEVTIRSLVTTNGTARVTCTVYRTDAGNVKVDDEEITITFDQAVSNNVTNLYTNYEARTAVFQTPDGRWQGTGATFIDLPREEGALSYNIFIPRHNSTGQYFVNVREPVTVSEYFAASVNTSFWGQTVAGKIRVWVKSWSASSSSTQAGAQANIEGRIPSEIANAQTRTVTVITQYP